MAGRYYPCFFSGETEAERGTAQGRSHTGKTPLLPVQFVFCALCSSSFVLPDHFSALRMYTGQQAGFKGSEHLKYGLFMEMGPELQV